MYTYHAMLNRVVDGDTIDLDVDLGFYIIAKLRFRLLGVDTPEVRGPEKDQGLKVKALVIEWLTNTDYIEVTSHKTGKYGRWLGTIRYRDPDGNLIDIANSLLSAGLARSIT